MWTEIVRSSLRTVLVLATFMACVVDFVFAGLTGDGIALTSMEKARHWKSLPIRICTTQGLSAEIVAALGSAVAVWNSSFGHIIFEVSCQAKNQNHVVSDLAEHSVFYITQGFGRTGDPLALARTLSSFDEDTGEMLDADILLNADSFNWSELKLDLKSILIHELGHMLGLQHLWISSSSVMHQYPYQSGIVRHRLGLYELTAIKRKYFGGQDQQPLYIDAFFSGNLFLGIRYLRQVANPGSDHYYAIGMIELKLENYASAIVAFKTCLAHDPGNVLARYRLADAMNRSEKISEAESVFKALLNDNPRFYEALADLALIYKNKGNKAEARRLFQKTLEVNPVHYPACYFLLELTGDKKYEECLKMFAPTD